jgi:hypothetical protein
VLFCDNEGLNAIREKQVALLLRPLALFLCHQKVHHEKLSSICHHRRESCDNLSVQKTGVDQPPRRGDQTPQTRRASTQ